MEALAFYLFAGVTLASCIAILLSTNIVRMAVWLLGALGGIGCLYFVLEAGFLAAIQFIVYVGGTLILIVFGVMFTTQSRWVKFTPTRRQIVGGVAVCLLLVLTMSALLMDADWPVEPNRFDGPTVADIGEALLGDYLVPFEVASVLLLVVMIGAAYMARPEKD